MKIVFLGPAYPYRGGLAAFNERLARQFTEECKDVEIKTFSLQYPGILFPGKSQLQEGPPPAGLRITRELNSINPFNWIITGLRLKKQRPDILLVRYWLPFMGPSLGIVSRIARSNRYTLIVAVIDNVIPHEKRPGDRFLTKIFMRSIDGAVVLSDSVKKDVELFRTDIPVVVSPHPIFDNYGRKVDRNHALTTLGLPTEPLYLLFFGFIRDYKGLDLLIEAFADSRLRGKNLKLIVAGEFYEDERPYLNLIKKYGLDRDVIIFNRFIEDKDVKLYFSGADLIVQPYKSATQSGVTQVAYQFEKPMVVTEVGGLPEIVPHLKCGYVVKPRPGDIAEAIADYFDNNRKAHFHRWIRKERERFTWHKMTDSVIEVFYKCLLKQLMKSL